ncbi:hypothetical protein [Alkalisalibacterium limincola]|uniref:Uncharacterized protein n=1 Tax=Alkalisalibacterium limincola TaxID=2699169 RepID=A0A5C8KIE8_9GAMM|nr:hypothetical protein [Alkalisalibacterium limincola]TXK59043.1 hypothetical protein FU658_14160 [Alkalisalibacterium limincola]
MKLVASAVALFVCAVFSATTLAAEDLYKVSFEIREAGELRSSPMVGVRADTEASISQDGEGWFKLDFTVSPTENGTIELNAVYESATHNLAPMMELELGKTATIGTDDVQLTVTVEPADV